MLLNDRLIFFNAHVDAIRSLCSDTNGLLLKNNFGDRSWSNVIKHCLSAAFCTRALCSLLGLSKDNTDMLVNFMIMHDAQKRLQIDTSFVARISNKEASDCRNNFDQFSKLSDACEPKYISEGIYLTATLEQQIVHYVDNLCLGGSLTYPNVRIKEVRSRRQDLSQEYWNKEIEATHFEQQSISNVLKSRGIICEPETLPSLIISELTGRNRDFIIVCSDLNYEYQEAFGPHFHTEWITATPRSSFDLNEDFATVKISDNFIGGFVIDGASAISSYPDDVSPGKRCARSAAEFLSELNFEQDPLKCLELTNNHLASSSDIHENGSINASACALIFTIQRESNDTSAKNRLVKIKFAALGDCDIAIKTKANGWQWLNYGAGLDMEIREINTALIESQRMGKNMKDVLGNLDQFPDTLGVISFNRTTENSQDKNGSGTLKGDPWDNVLKYVNYGQVFIEEAEFIELVAITDGAMLPVTVPEDIRKKALENVLDEEGIAAAVKERLLQGDENKDCVSPPCLKSKDDIGIIRIRACR